MKKGRPCNWRIVIVATAYIAILLHAASCTVLNPSKYESATPHIQPTRDQSDSQVPAPLMTIPPGYSSEIIHVKFREGTDIDPPEMALPPDLRNSVESMTPLITLSESELDKIGAGELRLWFQISLKPGTDAGDFIEKLKSQDNVETVEPGPLPAPPP